MRLLFTLLISLILTSSVLSQAVFIPQVGFNTSITSNNPDDLTSFVKPGWQAGFDIRFGKLIHIVPGLHYFETGTLLDIPVTGSPGDFESESIKVDAVKVPIKVGINIIPLGGLFRLRVHGGPVWTFNVNVGENDYLTKDDIKSSGLGIVLGGGIDVLFMFLDINYEIGTSTFYDSMPKSKIDVFWINLGFKVGAGKSKK